MKTRTKGNGAASTARVTYTSATWANANIIISNKDTGSVLCVHRMAEKSRKMMRDKQLGHAKRKPQDKQPVELMIDTLYQFKEEVSGSLYGIPAVAPKMATTRAFKFMDGFSMVDAKGFCHVMSAGKDIEETNELVPILAPPVKGLNYKEKLLAGELGWSEDEMLEALKVPHKYGACLREDDVRIGPAGGTADIRYRAAFNTWKIPFTVRYNTNQVSLEQLITAIDDGGQMVGICENRPEKSGNNWGTYTVEGC